MTGVVTFNEVGDRNNPVYEIQNINKYDKTVAIGFYGDTKVLLSNVFF